MVENYQEDTSIVEGGALTSTGSAIASLGKFITAIPIIGGPLGMVLGTPLVAVGDALQVVDAAAEGQGGRAKKLAVQGVTETAVNAGVSSLGIFNFVPDLLIKPTTGSALSTNAGQLAVRLVEGVDKQTKPKTVMGAPGWNPAYVQQMQAAGGSLPPMMHSTHWQDQVRGGAQVAQGPVMSGNPAYGSAVDRLAAQQSAAAYSGNTPNA